MPLFAKLHVDILDDPKLMRAVRKGAKHLHWLPWLIVFAKRADDDGRLTVDGYPAEPDDIARSIPNATKKPIAGALRELEQLGVLTRESSGALRFAAWDVRAAGKISDSREAVAARVRAHRERKRKRHNIDGNDGNALQGVTHVTPSNATERRAESESERKSGERENAPPAAAPFSPSPELPADAAELLARIGQREPEKVAAVGREMARYLNGGFEFRGELLRGSPARLGAKSRQVLALDDRKRIPRLWPYTCTKLADVSDGSAPGMIAEKTAADERRTEEGEQRDRERRINAWLEANPDTRRELEREAQERYPKSPLMHPTWIYQRASELLQAEESGEEATIGGAP